MINIEVDEKACVGCSLCADICPTDVFKFDEAKAVPAVTKPMECFGCLSCSEICPATAIRHTGIVLAETFQHDPYALSLASRLGIDNGEHFNLLKDKSGWDKALSDLGVRLLSVAAVFKQTLGGALPAVGTLAGRTLAGQLPRYQPPASFEETLSFARIKFSPAWEITPKQDGGQELIIEVKGCFVRDLCRQKGIPLGEEMCVLFNHYLTGYLGRMGKARLQFIKADMAPDKCVYTMKRHGN